MKYELNDQEMNIILQALAAQPYQAVFSVIHKIQEQIKAAAEGSK